MVVATQEGDVGVKKLSQHSRRPGQNLLARGGRRRHQSFGHLGDQFVKTSLVKKNSLARGLGGDFAKESTEGSHNGDLTLGPHPPVASDNQRTDNFPVEQLDRLHEYAPLSFSDGPGKGTQRLLATELALYSLTNEVKGPMRTLAN